MAVAYYVNKHVFDNIYYYSTKNDCRMSLWVDDVVISGDKAVMVSWYARQAIINNKLQYHKGTKFKCYRPSDNKEITGNIITPSKQLKLRNRSQKKIYDLRRKIVRTEEEEKTLRGCLNEASRIDEKYNKTTF